MKYLHRLFASGSNSCGQLATGNTKDSHEFIAAGNLPPDTKTIVGLASGANHTVILIERLPHPSSPPTRELWGCGDGRKGQLGPGFETCTPILTPVHLHLDEHGLEAFGIRLIAASWETSFIVLSQEGSNDVLISMGADDFGDLGIGKDRVNQNRTEQKPFHVVNLSRVIKGNQLRIISLVAGPHHVVLEVQTDGTLNRSLIGWGTSRHGQLGPQLRGKPFMSSPQILSTGAHISSFALGNQHTVILHDSGQCVGMGSDKKGQIRGISALRNVKTVDCTWNGTYVIIEDCEGAQLLSNGSNLKGQLGRSLDEQNHACDFSAVDLPMEGRQLRRIACGSEHVLTLITDRSTGDREVWGWGWNEHGNLGTGGTEDVHNPTRVWPPQLQVGQVSNYGAAVDIWAGCGTSWILVKQHEREATIV